MDMNLYKYVADGRLIKLNPGVPLKSVLKQISNQNRLVNHILNV